MKIRTTSILVGLLLVTAAFLLAQALSPNTGADRSESSGKSSSRDAGTSATEICDPQTIAKAVKGYTCVVKAKSGSVPWRVEAVIATESRTFRVLKDLKSGLYVSDDMGKHSHETALKENLCQAPDYSNQKGNLTSVNWRLPSGYPRSLNGKNGFPNHDSDFVNLEDDGIRQVIPGISSKYFVSSSEAGKPADYVSYGFDGEFGGIDAGCNGNGMASLRCVAQ
jgi:hypothetical protein